MCLAFIRDSAATNHVADVYSPVVLSKSSKQDTAPSWSVNPFICSLLLLLTLLLLAIVAFPCTLLLVGSRRNLGDRL